MKLSLSLMLACLLSACQHYAAAQAVPMFQMPLYFEDAVGNRDTLIIGYDTSDIARHLNTVFDGPAITSPLDSVFEVRAFHFNDDVLTQSSKKVINHYETWGIPNSDCGLSRYVKIVVSCKYPPLTISYDSTLLAPDGCRSNTIISPDWLMFFIQFWWKADLYYCLGHSSSIVDSLNFQGQKFWVEAEVEGRGLVELPGLFMVFRDWGPCTDPTLITVGPSGATQHLEVMAYPNPSPGPLRVEFSASRSASFLYALFDASGRMLQTRSVRAHAGLNSLSLSLEGLPAGTYTLRLTDGRASGSVGLIKI
ncbi:MAG TPA: T9SS type A sorting domain-containing protein [Saprospiraceae bacterium]|nr:T9SS type A sorting domain-containing protein [Saprospiraceae bacterium]HND89578.1 T9SS type A sorting domain-containing protein [Saprospiraceae bacterium]